MSEWYKPAGYNISPFVEPAINPPAKTQKMYWSDNLVLQYDVSDLGCNSTFGAFWAKSTFEGEVN